MAEAITLPVVNMQGQNVGSVQIDPDEFGGLVNKQLLHDVVVMYQANARLGTAKTKTRAEVAGSGRKLFRQKGTGNARVGDRRTGKRVGGGATFGPKPRDYSYSMPKKARRLATRMAVLSKFQDSEAVIVDHLDMPAVKTKSMAGVLKAIGLAGKSCLIATDLQDKNVFLSARNIHRVEVLPREKLNALAVLKSKHLVMTKAALENLRTAKAGDGE